MAKQVQRRGGSTAAHSSFIGAAREITIDTDKDVAVVHDGATAGGFSMLRADLSNIQRAIGGFINSIINGAFTVDQYPASAKTMVGSGTQYVVDQWLLTHTSTAAVSLSNDTITLTATAAGTLTLKQRIESIESAVGLNNRRALSFDFSVSAGTPTVTFSAHSANALDDFSSVTQRASGSLAGATSEQGTELLIPTNADFANGTEVRVSVALGAGDSISISRVQLELVPNTGPWSSTPFERRSFGVELSMCERHYQVGGDGSTSPAYVFSGPVVNGGTYRAAAHYRTKMRAVPTVALTNALVVTGFSTSVGSVGNSTVDGFLESRTANADRDSSSYGCSFTASAVL